ncbi:hypothetical protein MY11210_003485 [Beauveria gryllotalpidicola]
MGLVDYSSESDSSGPEAEAPTKPTPKSKLGAAAAPSKKVPSVVDKSKAGKIIVNLAGNAGNAPSDEPPAKRARTTGGGGRFSGFNAFLPAPKNTAAKSTTGGSRGVGLRTSAAPGFSRDAVDVSSTTNVDATGGGDEEGDDAMRTTTTTKSGGLGLPPPKNAVAEPAIPEGQKPAAEVRLTGKPLMFRPLSVTKGKPKKKTTTTTSTAAAKLCPPADAKSTAAEAPASSAALPEPPSKKKMSLFSMPPDATTPAPGPSLPSGTGAYEPLFETAPAGPAAAEAHNNNVYYSAAEPLVAESVGAMADDMNLSAAARRELFGRAGGSGSGTTTAQRVVNFNMDREYRHNEALRASGEQQTHNPVRAIQGGGKHSLRQLVGNVQSQKDALEDSFAKGKSNRREASSRYGW